MDVRAVGRLLALSVLCWQVAIWPTGAVDGDTLDAVVEVQVVYRAQAQPFWPGMRAEDLTLILPTRERIRLLGVDTPEMRGPRKAEAERAKEYTKRWLAGVEGQRAEPLWLTTCGRDAFGRLLGRVRRGTSDLSDDLIRAGHGVPRKE